MQGSLPGEVARVAGVAEHGRALLEALRRYPLVGFERSFKMAEGTLLANRYLAGVDPRSVACEDLLAVCRSMGMPQRHLRAFLEQLPAASAVHFGFEEGAHSATFKVYLEFASRLVQPAAGAVLLHSAFKWDAVENDRSTVGSYVCHPGLTTADILTRLEGTYPAGCEYSCSAVKGILEFACSRMADPPMYLEVSEEGNPRTSFDVNLHQAEVRLEDLESQLTRLGRHYVVPDGQLERLLEHVHAAKLGHLSGGVERGGKDFLTVYYDAEPW